MSTQNSETLKLYKNNYLYNGSRYQFLMTGRNDNQTFEQFLGTPDYEKTVYYKSISEPIPIKEFIKDVDQYTYGSITNDGKTYYFFVDNISTDSYGKTLIDYTIDWWTTNWQYINKIKGHIIRCQNKPNYMPQPFTPLKTTYSYQRLGSISKKGCIMFTYIPSTNNVQSYISLGILELTDNNIALVQNGYWYQKFKLAGADIKDCFIVPIISAEDVANRDITIEEIEVNTSEVSGDRFVDKLVNSFNQRFQGFNARDVFQNYRTYLNSLGETSPTLPFTPQNMNIKVFDVATNKWYTLAREDVWVQNNPLLIITPYSELPPYSTPPISSEHREYRWHYWEVNVDESEYSYKKVNVTSYIEDGIAYYEGYYLSLNDDIPDTYSFQITDLDITSNEKYVMGIQDWNSDIIWECPYGITVSSFTVRLLTGLSHVMLEFIPNGSDTNGNKITGAGFSYDCRHPALFTDSYQDYVLKNRDYDIEMRRIQSNRQELQAWVSTAENIGFGYAFGDTPGAVSAGVGGIIEAVSTRVLNNYYDPKIQKQYDERYKRMTDQISIVGDSITNVVNEITKGLLKIYTLTMDDSTQNRMKKDIELNGFYCDETNDDFSTLFTELPKTDASLNYTVRPVIQADNIIIEGACNVIGKQQIVRRLMNGVEFI